MEFIESVEEKEYTQFVINHPMSHFLKSYEWGELSKERGLVPHYVGIKENNQFIATALLLEKKLPLGYSYFYIPRGYTLEYDNEKLIAYFTEEIIKYTKKRKSLYFIIDPDIKLHTIDKDAKVVEDGLNNYKLVSFLKSIGFRHKKLNLYFENMQPRFTFRVDLTSDMDTIRKRYSKSVLRWIKQANKYEVITEIGLKEDISKFIHLMKLTEKRQGFFSHNYNFYPKLYDIFSKTDSVSLLIASIDTKKLCNIIESEINEADSIEKKQKLENRLKIYKSYPQDIIPVSSYINIHYGNKCWYLYGANDLNFKDTFANYKLFDYQIEHGYNLNKEIFDEFGTIGDPNSTKSVAGLHEFKKKFGGEYTEFIGEFTYVTKPFLYFIFTKSVVIYRKIGKGIRHLKVKLQGK